MAAPTQASFLDLALKSRLVTDAQVNALFPDEADRQNPQAVADGLVKAGLLTRYQAQMIQAGKHRGFFLGPYKILKPLGQGGMGTVFLAEHTSLSRKVAVKVLPPDKAKDKLTLERFNREARAAAALDHPNIVRLHDISQGNGVHFLVMEYVEGTDLQSLMGQTGPLHYAQAAQYVAQAAAGLHHAHEKGFIHRDVKPANLMLTKVGGGIKILDMGLARSFTDSKDALTANLAEGDIAGTVDYLSPEQAMNQPLDERSDIYSLGATFYSLVAGHPPFKGTTAQKLMQHQLKEPPSVSLKLSGRVPQALSDVISKMMAKKPSERFQSAADVVDALGPWLPVPTTGSIITDPSVATPMPSARSSGRTQPIRKSSRMQVPVGSGEESEQTPLWKRPPVLVGAGVGLLLLVGGIIAAVALSGGEPAKPTGSNPAWSPPPSQPQQQPPPQPSFPRPSLPAIKYEFTGLTAASVTIGGTGKGEVQGAIGGQRLPKGVVINHYDGGTIGEYSIAEANGVPALGLRQTNQRSGAQAHFFNDGTLTRLPEGTKATLRLTYLFEGTGDGQAFYELTGEPYTKYAHAKLPPTGGAWRAVDIPFTRPVGGKGYELVVNTGYNPPAEGTIFVRSVELLPPDAPPHAAAVYEFDAGRVTPFRRTGQTVEQNGKNEVALGAPGWFTEVYDKAGQGDFAAQREGNGGALGVAATGEKSAAQLAFRSHELPVDPLGEGKRYTAVLEYRTDRGTDGFSSVQTMDEWKTVGGANLSDTAGEWRAVTFAFTRPVGQRVQLTVGPKAANGGFVWVRRAYLTSDEAAARPAAAGKPLLALDLTAQKAFSRRGKSEANNDPIEDVRMVVAESGGGDPPTGWRAATWDLSAEMEYYGEEKDGRPAIGIRSLKLGGKNPNAFTGMLFTPAVKFTGGTAVVRFTYRTQTPSTNAVQLKFKPTVPDVRTAWEVPGAEALPGTGGKWVTRDVTVDLKGASGGFFEFHPFSHEASDAFHLSAFEVLDPSARAVAPPTPKSGVPVKADFAGFGIGTYALDKSAVAPADGWAAGTFDADAAGELTTTSEDGQKVVTLTNRGGMPSAQLYQAKPGGTLVGGGAYLLKLEYKATEGTTGRLEVRENEVGNWKDCPYSFTLEATADKWEARTFEVEATRDYPAVFVLQNLSDAAGNKLSVRKVELVPLGGSPTAPPPANEQVAYALDLSAQKAFAVRRKFRDTTDLSRTGDGTPPAGWRSHSWEPTCEHELFAEVRDGSPTLGLRFVGGKAAGMLAVDGITVKPNSTYDLTFEYQTPGDYTGDNGFRYRSTGNGGKLYLGGKLDKTDGKWVEKRVTIKTDAIASLQLEFHHTGPGGEANPLLIRKCALTLSR